MYYDQSDVNCICQLGTTFQECTPFLCELTIQNSNLISRLEIQFGRLDNLPN